jgi:membrane-associated protease RseP (regulator of RpoE activity)
MINESERDSYFAEQTPRLPAMTPADQNITQLRAVVSEVFLIETESDTSNTVTATPVTPFHRATVSFTGQLLIDSELAYEQLDAKFIPLNHIPVFSIVKGKQTITALKGRITVRPRDWRLNLALFVATVLSLMYVGASNEIGNITAVSQILVGLPYTIGVMLILGTHEFGHYFAARFHKVAVSLPYFIPLPLPGSLGTLGAFIQLREPMRNKKILLDIGAAGPLAGLIVAIPILIYGLKTSAVLPSPVLDLFTLHAQTTTYVLEGNSILYALAKIVSFGHFLPDGMRDVFINQWASAGWTGLLVTGLNLIPLGQLDGGHALYSLIGERARALFYPLLIGLVILSTVYSGWFLWVILLIMFGRVYATPLDTITPLNPGRRAIAILSLIVFFLVFIPIPFQLYVVGG